MVILNEGLAVGSFDGSNDGSGVGSGVGAAVGSGVGSDVGRNVGRKVAALLGKEVTEGSVLSVADGLILEELDG